MPTKEQLERAKKLRLPVQVIEIQDKVKEERLAVREVLPDTTSEGQPSEEV
jgi:hypothetical protein